VLELDTPSGRARAHLLTVDEPRAALVLGHGAGGGIRAPDLVTATEAGLSEGWTVVLVEQPYRVAGKRTPAPARQLDAAWTSAVDALAADALRGLALVTGGRSLGARVACRTAHAVGAAGVVCLAFPLQPRRRSESPPASRLPELEAVTVPTLVVQGERDPFGVPPPAELRTVVLVRGDHSLRSDHSAINAAVRAWLSVVLPDSG
jgi:predicted alpha/beta-hydrolase family hydrolase